MAVRRQPSHSTIEKRVNALVNLTALTLAAANLEKAISEHLASSIAASDGSCIHHLNRLMSVTGHQAPACYDSQRYDAKSKLTDTIST